MEVTLFHDEHAGRLGGYYARCILPDGREALVLPLTFGRARITAGPNGAHWFEDQW